MTSLGEFCFIAWLLLGRSSRLSNHCAFRHRAIKSLISQAKKGTCPQSKYSPWPYRRHSRFPTPRQPVHSLWRQNDTTESIHQLARKPSTKLLCGNRRTLRTFSYSCCQKDESVTGWKIWWGQDSQETKHIFQENYQRFRLPRFSFGQFVDYTCGNKVSEPRWR